MEDAHHLGEASSNPNPTYKTFRNVKESGAKGGGKTDDTATTVKALHYHYTKACSDC